MAGRRDYLRTIFGPEKTLKRGTDHHPVLGATKKEVIAIAGSWQRVTVPGNVTPALRQAGVYKERIDNG